MEHPVVAPPCQLVSTVCKRHPQVIGKAHTWTLALAAAVVMEPKVAMDPDGSLFPPWRWVIDEGAEWTMAGGVWCWACRLSSAQQSWIKDSCSYLGVERLIICRSGCSSRQASASMSSRLSLEANISPWLKDRIAWPGYLPFSWDYSSLAIVLGWLESRKALWKLDWPSGRGSTRHFYLFTNTQVWTPDQLPVTRRSYFRGGLFLMSVQLKAIVLFEDLLHIRLRLSIGLPSNFGYGTIGYRQGYRRPT